MARRPSGTALPETWAEAVRAVRLLIDLSQAGVAMALNYPAADFLTIQVLN
jgi:hypothetical protein